MSQSPLQLIVELRCKADCLDEVEQRASAFAQKTLEEPGCTNITFFKVNEDSQRFIFLAEFEDQESLEKHFEAAWREEAAADLVDLLVEPPRRSTMKRVA
jgi:quinol monooxygenase YgiN